MAGEEEEAEFGLPGYMPAGGVGSAVRLHKQ